MGDVEYTRCKTQAGFHPVQEGELFFVAVLIHANSRYLLLNRSETDGRWSKTNEKSGPKI